MAPLLLIVLLAACAGIIVLQIFLSKKESKWTGLILPIITFCISLIIVFGIVYRGDLSTLLMTTIVNFLLFNIPTAVLIAIYAACRGKRNKQRDLNKMRAQDLE